MPAASSPRPSKPPGPSEMASARSITCAGGSSSPRVVLNNTVVNQVNQVNKVIDVIGLGLNTVSISREAGVSPAISYLPGAQWRKNGRRDACLTLFSKIALDGAAA